MAPRLFALLCAATLATAAATSVTVSPKVLVEDFFMAS